MTTIALSYAELAKRLGINIASSRRLVHRKRWVKVRGNGGRALVQVPVEFLASRPSDSPSDGPNGSQHDSPDDSPSDGVTEILARLTAAQAELVEMALRLGGSEAAVAVLRVQIDEVRADRDHWREQATHALQRREEQQLVPAAKRRWWWRRSAALSTGTSR